MNTGVSAWVSLRAAQVGSEAVIYEVIAPAAMAALFTVALIILIYILWELIKEIIFKLTSKRKNDYDDNGMGSERDSTEERVRTKRDER